MTDEQKQIMKEVFRDIVLFSGACEEDDDYDCGFRGLTYQQQCLLEGVANVIAKLQCRVQELESVVDKLTITAFL